MNDEKKLNTSTFEELIEYRREIIDKEIAGLKVRLDELNQEIVALEDKKNPEYRKTLVSALMAKQEELRVHLELRPEPPAENPSDTNLADMSKHKELAKWELELKKKEDKIRVIGVEINAKSVQTEELTKLKREIQNKFEEYRHFVEVARPLFEKYSLKWEEVFLVQSDTSAIDQGIKLRELEIESLKGSLGVDAAVDEVAYADLKLKEQAAYCRTMIITIKGQLTAVEQQHQKRMEEHAQWGISHAQILGDNTKSDSLVFLQTALDYVEGDLSGDLLRAREDRLALARSIYTRKLEIKQFYDEIKAEIDRVLAVRCPHSNITISTSFTLDADFTEKFMYQINKGRTGTFRGYEDGKRTIKERVLNDLDTDNMSSIEVLLTAIIDLLEYDRREKDESEHRPTFIGDQVSDRISFYRFLFSLDYLEPYYELRQNGKSLEKLSPGEKGALLLVFYLLLDNNSIPLVIDQPEDNLDNHSVYNVLVPFIREAKKHRQILMVTHNPNLAVVADAEQVIRVSIDKDKANAFDFVSGSIENERINKAIVDVLEGTMPAFNTRNNKYYR